MASFSSLSILLLLLLLLHPPSPAAARSASRESLEIIIGGGTKNPDPNPKYPTPAPEYPPPTPKYPTPAPKYPPPTPKYPPPAPKYPPPPPEFENERLRKAYFVIQRLRKKITGGRMDVVKTWKGKDVCRYKGFRCDPLPVEKERAVSAVMFNGFKFQGPELCLEGFMDELDDIAVFHANSNFFLGPIPKKINRQRFFYELDLSNNKLPGGFPNNVLGASLLTFLDLRFNNYCGPIPKQLFNLDIISAIYINNNQFSSSLPSNLGRTPARFLTFANNQFTGQIPRSIGDAKKTMEEIVFFNNKLDGYLPCEIGNLENAVLFDAGKNRLTGPIPLSFACLAKAELLYLADNQLYGPVPEEICKLPKLGNFTLRNNFFTKVGPACKKLIKKKILDVSNNCIPGLPNQRCEEDCKEFACRPKDHGDDKSFTYIPCKNNYYLHSHVSKPSDNVNYVSPKRTYAALAPDPQ
ncbi:uncharacterized protein At4g06744-like [Cucurbita pepo subsp. pepo]|uniref:uncharacterized protein At4g06744-like n=1 Tax=Cucurbita pepo subsp. pepo TaxID=3664 RepID=UPI000C9D50D5|nr:uncharacterized protein At4g06744-like [Cucurbita pepo subsp. pepo]